MESRKDVTRRADPGVQIDHRRRISRLEGDLQRSVETPDWTIASSLAAVEYAVLRELVLSTIQGIGITLFADRRTQQIVELARISSVISETSQRVRAIASWTRG